MSIIIGADPGKTGALAMIDGDELIDAMRIPYAAPIERAWVVGGEHSEVKFTVPPIHVEDGVISGLMFNQLSNSSRALIYLEEPSMGSVNIRSGAKDADGEWEKRGTSKGVDASVNRAYQGLLQALTGLAYCEAPFSVSVKHWQAQLFKCVPRAIQSTDFAALGIPGNNKALLTKERARLACIFQWGVDVCVDKLKHSAKSSLLDSGRCDAACLALFGLLHQKTTPRLLTQPIASHMRQLGVK